ncbi:MAG: hypothetical protein IKR93_05300 [Firmicutes bacterium]|nr:hypothetical protein [Bacillota bacterium]
MISSENGSSGMVMPVAPAYGGGYGGGFGAGGDWWGILLLIALLNGGFGGFGGWGGMGGMMGLGVDFPWLLNGQTGINNNVSDGFRDAQIHDSITSVRDGVSNLATQLCGCCGDIQNTLCSGFAGTTAAVTGAQNAISQQLYSNELASLNRSFAEQTANAQGFNGVQSALCDIRYGSASNTRDIIESQTRGTQAVLDKLCALELDGYKRENDNLRQQLNMADLRASQTAQNAFISQGFANEVDALYNRLNSCPVPTTPVYGRTPIFTCNNGGCGCGGVGGFNGNF